MKGNYKKPMLNVEFFTLTQTIARDCDNFQAGGYLEFLDPSSCVWDMGDGTTVFIVDVNCMIDGDDMGFLGCYNSPSEGNYSFRS